MTSDDPKSSKKPKVSVKIVRALWKGSTPRKTGDSGAVFTQSAGRVKGEVVRVYGPYISKGTRKQQLADKLTAEFEKLLVNATEGTLREALESLRALQEKSPSRAPAEGYNVVIYHRNASGKFETTDITRPKSALSISYRSGGGSGGGTGSTGPGKPKARK